MNALAKPAKRAMPHSLEAETSVLGCLLIDNDALADVMEMLTPSSFYAERHRLIFAAMLAVNIAGLPIDEVTVADRLAAQGEAERVGGVALISELASAIPTSAHARAYATRVADYARQREIITIAQSIAEEGLAGVENTTTFVDRAQTRIMAVGHDRTRVGFVIVKEALVETFNAMEAAAQRGVKLTGVPSGMIRLDELTSGFQPSDLVVVAGRPSMGKTSCALQFAAHAASQNITTALFTLEMSRQQITQRLLGIEASLSGQTIRTGTLAPNDWINASQAAARFSDHPLWIDERGGLTVMDIAASCRRLKRDHGLGMVVIDQLSHIRVHERQGNRSEDVSGITRFLKGMAKILSVPVILVCQLNRALETRTDKRPIMSDLRESGGIENDADVIVFVHRDDYYRKQDQHDGKAELIIAKQRMGPASSAMVKWNKSYARFENDPDDEQPALPLAETPRKTTTTRHRADFTKDPDDTPFSNGDGT